MLSKEQLPNLTHPFTFQAHKGVSFRLYPDSKPHNLEIAALQKGLVLMLDGKELIEEGIGFGVPVVKYDDNTFFSSSAGAFIYKSGNCDTLVKSFILDAISRKRIWKGPFINDNIYSFFHSSFEKAYLGHKSFRPIFDKVMELRRVSKVHTQFVKVKPRGKINVKYRCLSNIVKVEVNLGELDRSGCKEILVLNEQGSTFFRRYIDTDGLELYDRQIGAWERVKAEEASVSDVKGTLTFTLKNVNGATLYRGWERIKGRFSWAGFSYSLRPEVSTFTYTIEVR